MHRRGVRRFIAIALIGCAPAFAADAAYRLDLGLSVREGTLRVDPVASGPAGKALRYEMTIRREGTGGTSSSSQSGTLRLGGDGNAHFAYNALSLARDDRYEISAKLYEGERLVAEQAAHQP